MNAKAKHKSIRTAILITALLSLLLAGPACSKGPKYNVVGKWETTIKYSNGKTFSPQWRFAEEGKFYEFGDEPWGTYKVKGDQLKITSSDGKQYYSGTFSNKTHMIGKLVYVGYEEGDISVTWEAVKIDE